MVAKFYSKTRILTCSLRNLPPNLKKSPNMYKQTNKLFVNIPYSKWVLKMKNFMLVLNP